jgi:hypothetical protein
MLPGSFRNIDRAQPSLAHPDGTGKVGYRSNSLPLSDFLFTNAIHQIADLLQQKAREKVPDLAPSMERFEALFLSFGVGRSNQ